MNRKTDGPRVAPAELEPLLDDRCVREILNTCSRRMLTLRASGALPYVKLGRSVRYRPADVRAFIARNLQGGAA